MSTKQQETGVIDRFASVICMMVFLLPGGSALSYPFDAAAASNYPTAATTDHRTPDQDPICQLDPCMDDTSLTNHTLVVKSTPDYLKEVFDSSRVGCLRFKNWS